MEAVFERFENALRNPQDQGLSTLSKTFFEIQELLAAHFRREEHIFYPALASMLRATDGEIAKLTDDHGDVRETS